MTVIVAVVVVALVIAAMSVRVIKQYERVVLFDSGRSRMRRGAPG
jgi:regulator of protease activity HflC (stomatin/prohibitin superfamily)